MPFPVPGGRASAWSRCSAGPPPRVGRSLRSGRKRRPGFMTAPCARDGGAGRKFRSRRPRHAPPSPNSAAAWSYRRNWQRYLKGILAGIHHHRGAEATGALFKQLCEQHRQLSSPHHWLKHFPLPRWLHGTNQTNIPEKQNHDNTKQNHAPGGCSWHAASY
jgi:hypothetical protein